MSTNTGSLSAATHICVSVLVLAGSGMQAYANGTIYAFFVAVLFLITGFAVVSIVFPGRVPELRAFLLTYALCVFVGGLAQCYSLAVFNNPQSTIDSFTFLRMISPQPPFRTMANMPHINSPLAVLIWQQVYKLTWWLGFDFGPYTGVMFNALVMGVTGSITVLTARELFGDDFWRLRRVGTLFALCGLFLLFGAVLLRDCFTSLLNALTLWGIIRWLCRPNVRNLFVAIVVTCISAYAMAYLRFESIVLFGLFWFLAILFRIISGRLNLTNLFVIYFFIIALIIGASYTMSYVHTIKKVQSLSTQGYLGNSALPSKRVDSLGMRLIIQQPMPIRLLLGSGSLMVFPIPLWGYFRSGALDYDLIKGYHGVYQMLILPLVFSGFLIVFMEFFKGRKQSIPFLFLSAYLLMNLEAVVATSLEQRHLAQFMSAFIILASVPDTKENKSRTLVGTIAITWFIIVILVHLLWVMAKY